MKSTVHCFLLICLSTFGNIFFISDVIAQSISVNPTSVTLAYSQGNGPAVYTFSAAIFGTPGPFSLSAISSNVNYTFSSADGQNDLGALVEITAQAYASNSVTLKLKAGLSVGSYPTSITFSSPGITPVIVNVTGTVAADNSSILSISATPTALTLASGPSSFSVIGTNLSSIASFKVHPPSGVAVSTDGVNFYTTPRDFFLASFGPQARFYLQDNGLATDPATVRITGGGANIASVAVSPSSLGSTGCANVASGIYPSSITNNSASLSWTGLTTGNYNLQWRPVGGDWTTVSGLTSNSYFLTGLSTGNVYEFQVQTICANSVTAAYGSPVAFTMCKGAEPSGVAVMFTSANLQWQGSGSSYNLQWKPIASATWNGPIALPATNYSLTGLTSNTGYEFRVQAVCSSSISSGYSSNRQFYTTACVNTASSLGSFGITTNTASLSWTAPGTQFSVRYKPVSSSNWFTVLINGFTSTISNLIPNTLYEWQIAIVCSSTELTGYTISKTFTTNPSSITIQSSIGQQGCNQVVSLSAAGGFPPYTYILTGNSQTFSNSTGQFIGLPTATYSVSAVDVNGSTGTKSLNIISTATPVTISPANATVCAGPTASLTATGCGSGTVVWATGQSGSVITVSTNAIGTTLLSISCVSAEGCIGVGSTVLTVVPSLPFAQITVSGQLGNSTTAVTITAQTSGATTYTFTGPNGFNESNVTGQVSVTEVGLYTIQTINTNGCLIAGAASALSSSEPLVPNTFVVNNMLTCPQDGGQPTGSAGLAAVATGDVFVFSGPDGYVFSNAFRTPGTYNVTADGITKEGSYTLSVYNQGALTGTYSEGISSTCTSTSASALRNNKSAILVGGDLRVTLGQNSTTKEFVSVSVEGAKGQTLQLQVFDQLKQLVDQKTITSATPIETQNLRFGTQHGSYYLKISTPTVEKTIWIAR